jgi:hypothetical protein
MLPAPLEESDRIFRHLGVRDRVGAGAAIALCTLGLAACGGGERQDVDEPEGEFPVDIVTSEFPNRQRLAQTSDLQLGIRNAGDETIPDLAITITTARTEDESSEEPATGGSTTGESTTGESTTEGSTTGESTTGESTTGAPGAGAPGDESFSVRSAQPGLSIPSRPVWILENGYPKLAGEAAPAGGQTSSTRTFSFGALEPGDTREIIWKVTPVQAGAYTISYTVAAGLQGKAVAVTADGSVPEGEFVVRISDVPPQTRVTDSGKVVPIRKGDIIGQAGTPKQEEELGGGTGGGQ